MSDTPTTQLLQRPDGSEALLLRKAKLEVTAGPDEGYSMLLKRPTLRVGSGSACDLQLRDTAVSRVHLELQAAEDGYLLRDLHSRNGTFHGSVRLQQALLTGPARLRLGNTTLRITPLDETVEIELSRRTSFGRLLGQSAAIREVFALLERAARSDSTVLIEGESGTGKELAAEAIHAASPRAEQPLVIVDCANLPPELMQSELFGHVSGAFTGAVADRAGAFEQADGGTVFLDEIGELPADLQPRLLRVLDTRQIKRVGATEQRVVDVRVIAATNRQLEHEVETGRFRADLFYRLSVIRCEIPPLRDRPGDIILLAHHFAERWCDDPHELLTDDVCALLKSHSWPGNVRELRNVVDRLAVAPEQALGQITSPENALSKAGTGVALRELGHLPFHEARQRWQAHFEREYLRQALRRTDGVVAHAAREAEIPRQSFHRLLRKHGLRGQ